jgi:hypothetical protein
MHPQIESVFDEAENRYLKPEELTVLTQYVSSLPGRLEAYRALRDRELEIMQAVADKLVTDMPNESTEILERSIKNALLVLRYCAMGTLMNDEEFIRSRLKNWLGQTIQVYNSYAIDTALYRLLEQALSRAFTPGQSALLLPMLRVAQEMLLPAAEAPLTAAALGW